jgi:hypothetical protein
MAAHSATQLSRHRGEPALWCARRWPRRPVHNSNRLPEAAGRAGVRHPRLRLRHWARLPAPFRLPQSACPRHGGAAHYPRRSAGELAARRAGAPAAVAARHRAQRQRRVPHPALELPALRERIRIEAADRGYPQMLLRLGCGGPTVTTHAARSGPGSRPRRGELADLGPFLCRPRRLLMGMVEPAS